MAANSWTQWQYLTPYGVGADGGVPQQPAGGNPPPQVWFRDSLDAKRSGRSDLTSGYPDGYLGTIRSRREDKPLDQLTARQNQRAYQRGVHMGERIDPDHYYWPPELEIDAGIRRQAMTGGARFQPLYPIVPAMSPKGYAVQDIDSGVGAASPVLRRMAPPWR